MSFMKRPLHLALRHKVSLQEKTLVSDTAGGYTTTWKEVATLWAGITPLRGSENAAYGQLAATATHRFRLRYSDQVRTNMRFVFAGRAFNIRYVENTDERNHKLDVLAEEGVAV